MSKALRHFLDLNELPTRELSNMLALSVAMKAKLKAQKNGGEKPQKPLEGKTLAMIFEKPSTRTRVSFDVGMRQLGGESIMLTRAVSAMVSPRPSCISAPVSMMDSPPSWRMPTSNDTRVRVEGLSLIHI